jgi:hypothetical protein
LPALNASLLKFFVIINVFIAYQIFHSCLNTLRKIFKHLRDETMIYLLELYGNVE